ncbi:hypothetical protein [Streptomyces sp. NPDC005009]
MPDQQQRRVRLRLARQTPSPARVRARVRDSTQNSDTASERKGIPWIHVGTVIGVVAGVGSLVFTGIATYYGAVTAQEQLAQAREDSEQQQRNQASRMAFWEEDAGRLEDEALHLVNRSADPVTNIDVRLAVTYLGKEYQISARDINVPPCMEVVYRPAKMTAWLDDGQLVNLSRMTGWSTLLVAFTDSAGVDWARGTTFLLGGVEGKNVYEKVG